MQNVVDAFHRLLVEHARVMQGIAVSNGLNPADIRVLKFLGVMDHGPISREVGAYLQMSPGAVTALLERLERRDFITRTVHPFDRRSAVISLTLTGQGVVDQLRGVYEQAIAASVPADRQPEFVATCELLAAALDPALTHEKRPDA